MAVHIGHVLRDLYLNSGLKMDRFRDGVPYSDKTIYYHFSQENLNTKILENYEEGLKKLGIEVDIWGIIARRRKGYSFEEAISDSRVSEPQTTREPSVAELLRQAATMLEKAQSIPVGDRETKGYRHG